MKRSVISFAVLLLVVAAGCSTRTVKNEQSINPLLGDASFVHTFGHAPSANADEDVRIATHLAYVEQLLRDADVSAWSPAQRERRAAMLDLLRDYHEAGVFPRNYDYPDVRKPCFIDKDGRICAVGYLVEQTAGREVAEKINEKYQYENLMAMNDPLVDDWVAASGLTKRECAMIQPAYGAIPVDANRNYVSKSYGISSAVFSGVNLSIGAINIAQLSRGAESKVMPLIGLATGVAQATMGIIEFPKDEESRWDDKPIANIGKRNVSLLNIGLGTANVLLSSWNLIANKPRNE